MKNFTEVEMSADVLIVAPRLIEELMNTRVVAPEKVVLSCRIDIAGSTAQVQWYRKGGCGCRDTFKQIDDSMYDISTVGDKMSLTIAMSQESDSATYRCEVLNDFGRARTDCLLVVLRMSCLAFYNNNNNMIIVEVSSSIYIALYVDAHYL